MLLVENIGRGAIADAIYTIDSIESIGRRAIRLNEALQNGLLTESRQQLLMEDLDKAMKNLQSSSQSSLSKLDDAIEYVDNFLDIGSKGGDTPIWELVDKSFQVAKDILNELTTIDLGFTGNIGSRQKFYLGEQPYYLLECCEKNQDFSAWRIMITKGIN